MIKELNDKYKNLLNNVSDKKEIEKEEDIIRMEVIKLEEFANKNNIPFVFNAEDIFINIQSLKTGVPEYYEY